MLAPEVGSATAACCLPPVWGFTAAPALQKSRDESQALAAGPRLRFLAGILLPSLACARGLVRMAEHAAVYYPARCLVAYIHTYDLSPSTCVADTQPSSAGAQLFFLQLLCKSCFVQGRWSVI